MSLYDQDGITHINIYSKGKTSLGRWMTNFAYAPVTLCHGEFNSLEGYWYWLGTRDERLRKLSGFSAKQLGRSIPNRKIDNFQELIKNAMLIKLDTYPKWKAQFISSSLPFKHYYVFGGRVVDAGFQWIVDEWERLRTLYQDLEQDRIEYADMKDIHDLRYG